MRVRCDPADVMGPWPRREAPALAGGDVLERLKFRPFGTVAADEQATRFGADVKRSVGRADRNRKDLPIGQLHPLPSLSAVAAEEDSSALRADDHATAIRGDAADRDPVEHRLSLSRPVVTVDASQDVISGADEHTHGDHRTLGRPFGVVLRRQGWLWGARAVCDGRAVRRVVVVAVADRVSGQSCQGRRRAGLASARQDQ